MIRSNMSLKDSANVGRRVVWTQRGIEACGGGFLGLFLSMLLGRSEERRKKSDGTPRKAVLDSILDLIEGKKES